MIKKHKDKYRLYTADGARILDTHDSYDQALAQERAINANRRKQDLGPPGKHRSVKSAGASIADDFISFFIKRFINAGEFAKSKYKISDFDPEQIKLGISVEYEHTDSKVLALKIALDHLAEIPDYYTRLAKMESDAKKELNL